MNVKFGSRFSIVILIGILVVAFLLRVYHIDIRPFHHDEGVNFHFLRELSKKGYYTYSHVNYHGPFYFYFAGLIRAIYGNSELALRLPSVIAGTLFCLLPIIVAYRGTTFVLLTATFMAISPGFIFHSRYAIHEMTFVFASVWFALTLYRYLDIKRSDTIANEHRCSGMLYQIAIALALMISTKETFVITGFALFLATFAAFGYRTLFTLIKENKTDLAKSFAVFIIIVLGIFSGGFRWFVGIREMFMAVPQWIGRGKSDVGHFKPFDYYQNLILKTEPWLIIIPALFVIALVLLSFFYRRNLKEQVRTLLSDKFLIFISVWSVVVFIVYSFVKYKTPWLVINISAPLIILCSYILTLGLKFHAKRFIKVSSVVILIGTISYSVLNSYLYNIRIPYGKPNPYSYVHTAPGMMRMLQDIKSYKARFPGARILVGVNSHWPLPYYFKDFESTLGYISNPDIEKSSKDYKIMILDKKTTWQGQDWSRKYFRLSDVQESFVYFYTPSYTEQ